MLNLSNRYVTRLIKQFRYLYYSSSKSGRVKIIKQDSGLISIQVTAANKEDFGDWNFHILRKNGSNNVAWYLHRAYVALQEQSNSDSSDHQQDPDIIDINRITTLGRQKHQTTQINLYPTASKYSKISNFIFFIFLGFSQSAIIVTLHLQKISGRNSRVREPGNEKELEVYGDVVEATNDKPRWHSSKTIESTDRINNITPWDLKITQGPVEDTSNESQREPVYIIPIEASTQEDERPNISTMDISYIIVGAIVGAILLVAVVILIIKFKKKSNISSSEDQGNRIFIKSFIFISQQLFKSIEI